MRLKILFLASSQPGHIDFGGEGFVKLAMRLAGHGHDVSWLTSPRHHDRLFRAGLPVDTSLPVDALTLWPLLTPDSIHTHRDVYLARISELNLLSRAIFERHPNLLVMDRVLALCPMLAAQRDIRVATIGTDGGYYARVGTEIVERSGPVVDYQEVAEALKSALAWRAGDVASAWGQSSLANIAFMGKSFYRRPGSSAYPSWTVHHFGDKCAPSREIRHGISFGNNGDVRRMDSVIERLMTLVGDPGRFEIFCGTRQDVYDRYCGSRSTGSTGPSVHRWVPFADHLYRLSTITFFGGIGTLWRTIDYEIPMLVVSGGIGDQRINCTRVAALDLGECLCGEDNAPDAIESRWDSMRSERHARSIDIFKRLDNYSDTIESAVLGLERLCGMSAG